MNERELDLLVVLVPEVVQDMFAAGQFVRNGQQTQFPWMTPFVRVGGSARSTFPVSRSRIPFRAFNDPSKMSIYHS